MAWRVPHWLFFCSRSRCGTYACPPLNDSNIPRSTVGRDKPRTLLHPKKAGSNSFRPFPGAPIESAKFAQSTLICDLLAVHFFVVYVGNLVAGRLALGLAILAIGTGETLAARLAILGTSGGVHLL